MTDITPMDERWAEPHQFQPADEHEFCSWCGAPAHAPCHRQPCEHGEFVPDGAHHCYDHCLGEDPVGAYKVCFECGHVYRRKKDLRRAYKWERPPVLWTDIWPVRSKSDWHPGLLKSIGYWFRCVTISADKIAFCQECIHDF